jgi:hypothetical protein
LLLHFRNTRGEITRTVLIAFPEKAHRERHTPRHIALAIADAYRTIGLEPDQAIKVTKRIHNQKDQKP